MDVHIFSNDLPCKQFSSIHTDAAVCSTGVRTRGAELSFCEALGDLGQEEAPTVLRLYGCAEEGFCPKTFTACMRELPLQERSYLSVSLVAHEARRASAACSGCRWAAGGAAPHCDPCRVLIVFPSPTSTALRYSNAFALLFS